jgi:hypothetical protein
MSDERARGGRPERTARDASAALDSPAPAAIDRTPAELDEGEATHIGAPGALPLDVLCTLDSHELALLATLGC